MADRAADRVRRFKRRLKTQHERAVLGVVDADTAAVMDAYMRGGLSTVAELLADGGAPVEPIDLTAPASVLVSVPWTTPTTDENALDRTLELADLGYEQREDRG
jgi:hypothetical protein